MKLESLKMNLKSLKSHVNNQKGSENYKKCSTFNEKMIKSSRPSTSVENLLQISFCFQNKANVKIGKTNLSIALIKDYEEICGLVQ